MITTHSTVTAKHSTKDPEHTSIIVPTSARHPSNEHVEEDDYDYNNDKTVESAFQYHPRHFPGEYQPGEGVLQQSTFPPSLRTTANSVRVKLPHYKLTTGIRQQPHYHQQVTNKPPLLQIPLPLIPTLSPLTFSTPSPFSLPQHLDKRYADHNGPRIIISASASISDQTGRRLNYSLGTIGDSEYFGRTPPASYDDYKEDDIRLDPFYNDVPKVKHHLRRRRSEGSVLRDDREAAEVLKFLLNWYASYDKTTKISIPLTSQVITEINSELSNLEDAGVESETSEETSLQKVEPNESGGATSTELGTESSSVELPEPSEGTTEIATEAPRGSGVTETEEKSDDAAATPVPSRTYNSRSQRRGRYKFGANEISKSRKYGAQHDANVLDSPLKLPSGDKDQRGKTRFNYGRRNRYRNIKLQVTNTRDAAGGDLQSKPPGVDPLNTGEEVSVKTHRVLNNPWHGGRNKIRNSPTNDLHRKAEFDVDAVENIQEKEVATPSSTARPAETHDENFDGSVTELNRDSEQVDGDVKLAADVVPKETLVENAADVGQNQSRIDTNYNQPDGHDDQHASPLETDYVTEEETGASYTSEDESISGVDSNEPTQLEPANNPETDRANPTGGVKFDTIHDDDQQKIVTRDGDEDRRRLGVNFKAASDQSHGASSKEHNSEDVDRSTVQLEGEDTTEHDSVTDGEQIDEDERDHDILRETFNYEKTEAVNPTTEAPSPTSETLNPTSDRVYTNDVKLQPPARNVTLNDKKEVKSDPSREDPEIEDKDKDQVLTEEIGDAPYYDDYGTETPDTNDLKTDGHVNDLKSATETSLSTEINEAEVSNANGSGDKQLRNEFQSSSHKDIDVEHENIESKEVKNENQNTSSVLNNVVSTEENVIQDSATEDAVSVTVDFQIVDNTTVVVEDALANYKDVAVTHENKIAPGDLEKLQGDDEVGTSPASNSHKQDQSELHKPVTAVYSDPETQLQGGQLPDQTGHEDASNTSNKIPRPGQDLKPLEIEFDPTDYVDDNYEPLTYNESVRQNLEGKDSSVIIEKDFGSAEDNVGDGNPAVTPGTSSQGAEDHQLPSGTRSFENVDKNTSEDGVDKNTGEEFQKETAREVGESDWDYYDVHEELGDSENSKMEDRIDSGNDLGSHSGNQTNLADSQEEHVDNSSNIKAGGSTGDTNSNDFKLTEANSGSSTMEVSEVAVIDDETTSKTMIVEDTSSKSNNEIETDVNEDLRKIHEETEDTTIKVEEYVNTEMYHVTLSTEDTPSPLAHTESAVDIEGFTQTISNVTEDSSTSTSTSTSTSAVDTGNIEEYPSTLWHQPTEPDANQQTHQPKNTQIGSNLLEGTGEQVKDFTVTAQQNVEEIESTTKSIVTNIILPVDDNVAGGESTTSPPSTAIFRPHVGVGNTTPMPREKETQEDEVTVKYTVSPRSKSRYGGTTPRYDYQRRRNHRRKSHFNAINLNFFDKNKPVARNSHGDVATDRKSVV